MIRLNEAQYRKVKKLTRRLCANNDGGCCLLLDDGDPCVCVQAISFSLLCRYFREAVLPADRELCADIMRQHDTRKKCELCGKPFHARSNRAKYCDACAVLAARRMACERKRRERERNAKIKLQGDTVADFEQIYKDYFRDVFLYVRRLSGGNERLAEDITSEAFFRALRVIDTFRGDCDIRVWLCQIAKNCYYTYLKQNRNVELVADAEQCNPTPEETPDEVLLRNEDARCVKKLLILYQGLTYMQDSDLRLLTTGITVGFISFSLIINWTGYYRIIKRFNMGRK